MNELNVPSLASQNEELASLKAENAELRAAFKRSVQTTWVMYAQLLSLLLTLLLLAALFKPSKLSLLILAQVAMWSFVIVTVFFSRQNYKLSTSVRIVLSLKQGLKLVFRSLLPGLLFVLAALLWITLFLLFFSLITSTRLELF